MTDFLAELKWRGLLHQTTGDEAVSDHLATPGRVGYCGFDPTSHSLTIGNLIPIMLLRHFQRAGHRPVVLLGGGTGLIGDPSGKDAERQLRTRDDVAKNVASQRKIFERLLDFDGPNAATLVNNLDWLEPMSYLDMLRDVGKYFSVNQMIQKDSVRDRLQNREQGISYTEFSYMILQGYDFLHLFREDNCTLQIAGSDQYGNIVAGLDLIRREQSERPDDQRQEAFGVTAPLVTKADGKKIGKTESGAIWLTADMTSPYRFHQFWLNADDADVGNFLRWYTDFQQNEIEDIEAKHAEAPHERLAQRRLADAVTDLVHGVEERQAAEAAASALFGRGELPDLTASQIEALAQEVPGSALDADQSREFAAAGLDLVDLLPTTSLAQSRREAREFVGNGAISCNGIKLGKDDRLTTEHRLHGRWLLLRRGRKNWHALDASELT